MEIIQTIDMNYVTRAPFLSCLHHRNENMIRTRYILRRRRKLKAELASNDNQAAKAPERTEIAQPPHSEVEPERKFLPAA